jgi:F-type H+-transporting ATPase subunit b
MKSRTHLTIIAIVAVMLCPALAHAADDTAETGSWGALIFYIINFALFFWIVRRFAGQQITAFFHNRARNIRENLSRADAALAEAQSLSRRALELMEGLAAEKSKVVTELNDETAYLLRRIDEGARGAADRIRRDAGISVAAAREAGRRHLREALAAAAARIARELVRHDFRPADQTRLLETFVGRLRQEARN